MVTLPAPELLSCRKELMRFSRYVPNIVCTRSVEVEWLWRGRLWSEVVGGDVEWRVEVERVGDLWSCGGWRLKKE